jgi:hypothetical protein
MNTRACSVGLFLLLASIPAAFAQPILSIDISERGTDASINTMPGFDAFFITSDNGTGIQTASTIRTFGALTVTLSLGNTTTGYDDRLRTTPVNTTTFTDGLLLRDFVFSRDVGTGGLDVAVDGLTPSQFYKVTIWSFDSSSTGRRVSDWKANGNVVMTDYTFDGRVLPTNNIQYRFSFIVAASETGRVLIEGRRDPASVDTANAASFGVFLNALQIEPTQPQPSIVTQPASATRAVGDRHTFSITVNGAEPLSYRWFKDGAEITGATGSTLTLFNLNVSDSGNYSVQVTNAYGSVTSSNAVLSVVPDPAPDVQQGLISYWPLDQLDEDQFPIFTTPDLYSHNDLTLVSSNFFDQTPGAYGSALLFNGVDQYAVRTGGFPIYNNSAYSLAFWVSATGTGQTARRIFSESSTNANNPLFTFGTHNSGLNGSLHVFIRTDTGGVLVDRHSTRTALDGTWHHVVWTETNGFARLYIDGVLDETEFSYARGALSLNATTLGAILRTNVSNYLNGAVDDVAVWTRVLSFSEIQQIRTNGIPSPVRDIPPALTQQPVSQSVLTRDDVTFSLAATGTSPLQPQWRKNGSALSGETNFSLVLSNVTLADAGDFDVIITNSAGSVTSLVATLTVTLRPAPPAQLKIDFNNTGQDTAAETEVGFDSFVIPTVGPGPVMKRYGGVDLTVTGVGANLESRRRATPTNDVNFTEQQLFQDFLFARDAALDQGMDIVIEFLEPNTLYAVTLWSFDSGSTGNRVSDWTANGSLVQSAYTFNGSTLPTTNGQYRIRFNVTSDIEGKILIQGRRSASASGNINVFVNALTIARSEIRVGSIDLVSPGTLRLTFNVLNPSATHRIEEKVSLDDANWTEVSGVSFSAPTGDMVQATFAAPDSTRFYRVVEAP